MREFSKQIILENDDDLIKPVLFSFAVILSITKLIDSACLEHTEVPQGI